MIAGVGANRPSSTSCASRLDTTIRNASSALPPAADVSVTCSPAKGIAATQEYTERLLAAKKKAKKDL